MNIKITLWAKNEAHRYIMGSNVWGEPVFSVMAAGWFCEKFG